MSAGRYIGHLRRQEADVNAFLADETLVLDPRLDYSNVQGISSEVRERLRVAKPASIVRPSILASCLCTNS